ncbi:hypothetical protein F2P81_017677 [Scophthalmus maximus]|uniref:Uncharacterized protein n=1 Tax=Scophthalmus maximus TaxID=52904 RepID=A0A6A4S6V2_SCOMX|nr:hypothetical protein F2P81_017677 [Scophthalmus maximus]
MNPPVSYGERLVEDVASRWTFRAHVLPARRNSGIHNSRASSHTERHLIFSEASNSVSCLRLFQLRALIFRSSAAFDHINKLDLKIPQLFLY